MLYTHLLRPLLFRMYPDPEDAHELALGLLENLGEKPGILARIEKRFQVRSPKLEQNLMGIHFPNPVGLAAGYSKDGRGVRALAALGFGHLELGTVTPPPQEGNPRQRMFRIPEDQALINRMGFNNPGAAALARKIQETGDIHIPIGVSLGKAKITPLEEAANDYVKCLETTYLYGAYFVINVSSPNTPGLRSLQGKEELQQIVRLLVRRSRELAQFYVTREKPILIKISPDLTDTQIDEVHGIIAQEGACGVIAANTTIGRQGLTRDPKQEGGLSGSPVFKRALEIVRHLRRNDKYLVIIGSGGIHDDEGAIRMFGAGANLLQILTGLIYEGPLVVNRMLEGILNQLAAKGLTSVRELQPFGKVSV